MKEEEEMDIIEEYLKHYTECTNEVIRVCYAIAGYNLSTIRAILYYYTGENQLPNATIELMKIAKII